MTTRRPHPARGPNFRKLWSSSAVSNLADGTFIVALPGSADHVSLVERQSTAESAGWAVSSAVWPPGRDKRRI